MPVDIILYAVIAAGLIFWLMNILGTGGGDEKQRQNPYVKGPESLDETAKVVDINTFSHDGGEEKSAADAIAALCDADDDLIYAVCGAEAKDGLIAIADAKADFDIKQFLDAAQDAFAIVVESFAAGDRETLKSLLSDDVYKAFDGAISAREEDGRKAVTEIHAIKKSEVLEAGLKGKMAHIVIRFTASETSVEYDKDGEILSGHPDKVTDMRDIWVFSHDVKGRDPRWLLQETRGDFEGDNDLIPNTDS